MRQHRRKCFLLWAMFGVLTLLIMPSRADETTDPAIESIIAQMSLRQQVAQMFVATFYGNPLNEPSRDFLQTYQPGMVALLPSNLGNPQQVAQLSNDMQAAITQAGGIPLFVAVDQEGGIIAHLEDGFTRWPVPMLLTATQNPELAYKVGEAYAEEMRAVGLNMNLAPVADLYTNPDNPIIGRRSFGARAEQVTPIVTAFAQGMQSGGVLAVAKHFPGHGDTSADSHVTLPVVDYDAARLHQVEMAPFVGLAQGGVGAIMTAHIWYPALEPESLVPASLSERVVTGVLRDEMAYQGLIMTDAMDMDAIDINHSPQDAALMAVMAGNDLILTGAHVSLEFQAQAIEGVIAAVEAGEIEAARITSSVRRILRAKQQMGVLDWAPVDVYMADEAVNLAAHAEVVTAMFEEGIAVAYGADQLPLQQNALLIYPASQPSLWRACAQYAPYQPMGYSDTPSADESAWARGAAAGASQVVIFTRNLAENAPLLELVNELPPEKTIVVAMHAPEDWQVIPEVRGYVMTYSPLFAAYEPLCAILSGALPAKGQVVIDMAISP